MRDLAKKILALRDELALKMNSLFSDDRGLIELTDQICSINPSYCDDAVSLLREARARIDELRKEAEKKGLRSTAEALRAISDYYGSDRRIYRADKVLDALWALIAEAEKRCTSARRSA